MARRLQTTLSGLSAGQTAVIYNPGSVPVNVVFGSAPAASATTGDFVAPGGWTAFVIPSGATKVATWGIGGSTTLQISGGSGLPIGVGSSGSSGSVPTGTAGSPNANVVSIQGAGGTAIQTTPKAGTFTFPGCTVGTSSAQCLAAGTYNHVQFVNNSAVNIACAWGGTAILSSATSIQLAPGQPALWGPATAGVPNVALNCIAAAASSPLYLETN